MDVNAYLDRIRYSGPTTPGVETLRALHLAHLYTVPFENLDIHLGRWIILDEERLYEKIVRQRRGGFCYELNGMFGWLLRELGFRVSYLNARVANAEGVYGIDFDHLTLRVDLDEPWLADVGFGDSFREPLRFNTTDPQPQPPFGAYRLIPEGEPQGDYFIYQSLSESSVWQPQYRFSLTPYRLQDFEGGCHHNQTSPDSHFTQKRVCTLATPEGRITLRDTRLIRTANGTREERPVADESAYNTVLRDCFDIAF